MTEIALPSACEAEQTTLGAVFIDPEAYLEVSQVVNAGDFYVQRNRWVWEAMMALNERRSPIDYLTVCAELEKSHRLEEAGGPAYLMKLISQTPSSLHAEAYAAMVAEAALRRRLITAAQHIIKLGFDTSLPIEGTLQQAEQLLLKASDAGSAQVGTTLSQIVSRVYDQVQQAAQSNLAFLGLPSGLDELDHVLKGFQKGQLIVLAGRPGTGKTSFLMTAALHAGLALGKRVALFSLEMSEDEIGHRFLSQQAGIDGQRLKMGQLTENEAILFVHAVENLASTAIAVDDTPALSPAQLRARCRRLHAQQPLDLIIVDYLQLMSGGGKFENRQAEVAHISRQLKALAKELNVPLLAAAQLSRAVEQRGEKRPQLSDLRDSGGIEQDSDVVMFLFWPETPTPLPANQPEPTRNSEQSSVEVNLEVAKQRSGPTRLLSFRYRPAVTRFENQPPAAQTPGGAYGR